MVAPKTAEPLPVDVNELPRCQHGSALADWSGEHLEPPCGCRMPVAQPLSADVEAMCGHLERAEKAFLEDAAGDERCAEYALAEMCHRSYTMLRTLATERDEFKEAFNTMKGMYGHMIKRYAALATPVATPMSPGDKGHSDVWTEFSVPVAAPKTAEPVARKVFLVATGLQNNRQELYERYDDCPPPLCDYEGPLYTHQPVAIPLPANVADAADLEAFRLGKWAVATPTPDVRAFDPDKPWWTGAEVEAAIAHAIAQQPSPICQYALDVGMPEHRCAKVCQYADRDVRAFVESLWRGENPLMQAFAEHVIKQWEARKGADFFSVGHMHMENSVEAEIRAFVESMGIADFDLKFHIQWAIKQWEARKG